MKKYSVYGHVHATKYMGTYLANSPEEAEEMAYAEQGHVFLCHECNREVDDPQIEDVTVEEEEE